MQSNPERLSTQSQHATLDSLSLSALQSVAARTRASHRSLALLPEIKHAARVSARTRAAWRESGALPAFVALVASVALVAVAFSVAPLRSVDGGGGGVV
mgnify:CR=1 FL=1|tara:strand:+ start:4571 stop:4867 length:297 start_codon:yes stop_codon:yes gene_type:complete